MATAMPVLVAVPRGAWPKSGWKAVPCGMGGSHAWVALDEGNLPAAAATSAAGARSAALRGPKSSPLRCTRLAGRPLASRAMQHCCIRSELVLGAP